jgi:hypothetical protein
MLANIKAHRDFGGKPACKDGDTSSRTGCGGASAANVHDPADRIVAAKAQILGLEAPPVSALGSPSHHELLSKTVNEPRLATYRFAETR